MKLPHNCNFSSRKGLTPIAPTLVCVLANTHPEHASNEPNVCAVWPISLHPRSKLHPEMGEVLLKDPPTGSSSSSLPPVLRLCGKLDLLDQVRRGHTHIVTPLTLLLGLSHIQGTICGSIHTSDRKVACLMPRPWQPDCCRTIMWGMPWPVVRCVSDTHGGCCLSPHIHSSSLCRCCCVCHHVATRCCCSAP